VTLLQQARTYWPFYIAAWLYFPVLLVAVRYGDVSLADWFWPAIVFSLAAGLGPLIPLFRRQVSNWQGMALAIGVPIGLFLLSMLSASAYDAA
jgi:hypothetical protein